ncbi:MAG: hypothetical protein [Wendovervirus sonii]|uniref:Uncharacterized protein n=1 Tax=phage Lak_Megaphage_Sonny TaxID=3109229 RepID=A0ABZ0Z322_9CAUD|nr:MAG: hypothetical protein [phage Lak_Megaphage_Sonny]
MYKDIPDFTKIMPDDWMDETKYPNKVLESSVPESYNLENKKEYYFNLIIETWTYDDPNNADARKYIFLKRCPKCGSYHITSKNYDNLDPMNLAGSIGINHKCENCGFWCNDIFVQS